MTRAFEYRHVVLFEETNLVGNVYFVHHLSWQGACRERFLRDHAPSILDELRGGLALVTVSCQCDYLAELNAFDEIVIRMRLVDATSNRLDLRFDYSRVDPAGEAPVASGRQRIASMRRVDGQLVPIAIPAPLVAALRPFATPA